MTATPERFTAPNPGSDEARKQGCICAVMDNAHGRGYLQNAEGEWIFVVTVGCPLHAPDPEDEP